jgi:hypothetical protein
MTGFYLSLRTLLRFSEVITNLVSAVARKFMQGATPIGTSNQSDHQSWLVRNRQSFGKRSDLQPWPCLLSTNSPLPEFASSHILLRVSYHKVGWSGGAKIVASVLKFLVSELGPVEGGLEPYRRRDS